MFGTAWFPQCSINHSIFDKLLSIKSTKRRYLGQNELIFLLCKFSRWYRNCGWSSFLIILAVCLKLSGKSLERRMRAALWQAPLASGIPLTQEHEYFFSCPGLLLVCEYSICLIMLLSNSLIETRVPLWHENIRTSLGALVIYLRWPFQASMLKKESPSENQKRSSTNVQKFISTNILDYKLMSYCKNCS